MIRYVVGVAVWLAAAGVSRGADDAAGVEVLFLNPHSPGARVELRPGDVLHSWEHSGASGGRFESPIDFYEMLQEYGPIGGVRVKGLRGGKPLNVTLPGDTCCIDVAPASPRQVPEIYKKARRLIEQGKSVAGVQHLQDLEKYLPPGSSSPSRLWALIEIVRGRAETGRNDEAVELLERGTREARLVGGRAAARWHDWRGRILRAIGRPDEAWAALEEGLTVRRGLGPDTLLTAVVLIDAARTALEQGKGLAEGRVRAEQALAIRERLAPGSYAFAQSLELRGLYARAPREAVTDLQRALELKQKLAPDGQGVAATFAHLAGVVPDLRRRAELASRAVAVGERSTPDGCSFASGLHRQAEILTALGDPARADQAAQRAVAVADRCLATNHAVRAGVHRARGELADAESMAGRGLRLAEQQAPGGTAVARLLGLLGDIAHLQGDVAAAESYLTRCLVLAEHEADPGAISVCLARLGDVALDRGDVERAVERHRRAAATLAEVDPTHPGLDDARRGLARGLLLADRLDEADALLGPLHATGAEQYPKGPAHAETLQLLGDLALRRGDLDKAERHYRAALGLREAIAPGTLWTAESSRALGIVAQRRSRREEAVGFFRNAVAALEAQRRNLGGTFQAKVKFGARYDSMYRDLEELLIDLARPQEAFHAAEHRRSRALLLVKRRSAPGTIRIHDVAELTVDLGEEQAQADAEYDRVLTKLAQVPAADTAARDALRADLKSARHRQDEVRARHRWRAIPVHSDLPPPLDLARTRPFLAPQTLLLVYSLSAGRGRVYAVGPGPDDFGVFPLAAGDTGIREGVRRFRDLVDSRRSAGLQEALRQESRRLGDVLLGPVAPLVERARSLLIVPDGPLHLVPFAALAIPGAGEPRFLAEAKAVQLAPSVTLYAELTRSATPPAGRPRVVGFGDPSYPAAGSVADATLRDAVERGLQLGPLPRSRAELAPLEELAPGGTEVWYGPDATEDRVKALDGRAQIVHFACHGFVDEDFPLESGIALSIPQRPRDGEDNGLLQAWEIIQDVHLDAELVTLSACRTAVGKEMGGEGLFGLTWAFLYSGARSVLASLWDVNDASTSELMRRFYGHVKKGVPKAEALRLAQVELLRTPATAAPFFWAAFQILGDSR